jgi:hypothetical protein
MRLHQIRVISGFGHASFLSVSVTSFSVVQTKLVLLFESYAQWSKSTEARK